MTFSRSSAPRPRRIIAAVLAAGLLLGGTPVVVDADAKTPKKTFKGDARKV